MSSPSLHRRVLLVTGLGLLAFLMIQGLLAAYNVHLLDGAIDRGIVGGDYPTVFRTLSLRLLTSSLAGGVGFLLIALVGIAIAGRGHRFLFMVPAVALVFGGLVTGGSHDPQPIGTQWLAECWSLHTTCRGPWFSDPWFGAFVDLALVALPGWIVGMRVRAHRWPGKTDVASIASIVVIGGAIALAGWTIAVVESYLDVRQVVAIGVLGLGLGTARPWWPWLHVVFALFVTGAIGVLWEPFVWPSEYWTFLDAWRYAGESAWPFVAVGLLASAWKSLAWALRRSQDRPLRLVIVVNVLNIADAVLTTAAVRAGDAVEANPLVRVAGLPAKVILVGVLTWLLYRRQPKALVWPAAALLLVLCYHVAGIFVNP